MKLTSLALRFTTALVSASLLAGPVTLSRAFAQPADPASQDQPSAAAAQDQPDPPAQVGRLARVRGTVSFHPAGAENWDRAQANWPLTTGNAIWTEPDGRAELELAGGVIQLEGGSEFAIDRLDATSLGATLRQGEIRLRLANLAPGQSLRVQTPRGLVTIATPGSYEITAGDTEHPTRLTVHRGAAELGDSLRLGARQTALVTGSDPFTTATEPAGADRFQSLAPPRAPVRPAGPVAAPPPVIAQMPGGADLAGYGAWQPTPEYGAVWYPPVAADWAPYRTGHWAYVAPWGWTWIDDAAWGFAPFHYGRWLQYGGRWGWTPGGYDGGYAQPGYLPLVYAPALVTFFGVGLAVGAVIGAGLYADSPYRGNVGWLPLGPREAYRPWYPASQSYVRNVNINNVTNITTINNGDSIQNFRNRGAATQMPAAAMAASRPVRLAAQPLAASQFATARPIIGQQPIRPSAATAGIPASGAPRPGAGGNGALAAGAIAAGAVGAGAIVAARARAPGPAIQPAPTGQLPQTTLPQTSLRPALVPSPTRPAGVAPTATTNQPPVGRPASGLPPALPQPGLQRPAGIATPGAIPPRSSVSTPMPANAGISNRLPTPTTTQPPGQPAAIAVPRPLPAAQPQSVSPRIPQVPMARAPMGPAAPPPARVTQPNPGLNVAPAQPAFHAPPEQPAFRAPPAQPAFRAPPAQPAFHAPPEQPAFRAPPAQPAYRAPQAVQAPPPQPVFRPPPPAQPAFRPPPPQQQPVFHAPPPQQPAQTRPAPPPQRERSNGRDRQP